MKIQINSFTIKSKKENDFLMMLIASILNRMEVKGFLNNAKVVREERLYTSLQNLMASLETTLSNNALEMIAINQNQLKLSDNFNSFINIVKKISKKNGSSGLKFIFILSSEDTDILNRNLTYLNKIIDFVIFKKNNRVVVKIK